MARCHQKSSGQSGKSFMKMNEAIIILATLLDSVCNLVSLEFNVIKDIVIFAIAGAQFAGSLLNYWFTSILNKTLNNLTYY